MLEKELGICSKNVPRIKRKEAKKRPLCYTDIIVTTEQGHTAVESYFLDCDRENRLQSAIDAAFDKDSDD